MFFWMFSKVLLQLNQSILMKRSMTEFGSVLGPFFLVFWLKSDFTRDSLLKMRLCPKCIQWISILVAFHNIFKNWRVHRRYPSPHTVAFRLKYFLGGDTFNDCDTVELTNKQKNNRLHGYCKYQMLI